MNGNAKDVVPEDINAVKVVVQTEGQDGEGAVGGMRPGRLGGVGTAAKPLWPGHTHLVAPEVVGEHVRDGKVVVKNIRVPKDSNLIIVRPVAVKGVGVRKDGEGSDQKNTPNTRSGSATT